MSNSRLEQRTFNTASCSTQQQSAELPLNIMVDHNLIADIGLEEAAIDATGVMDTDMEALLATEIQQYRRGKILTGKIVGKAGDVLFLHPTM